MTVAGRVPYTLEQERFTREHCLSWGHLKLPFIVGMYLEMVQLVPVSFWGHKPVAGAL